MSSRGCLSIAAICILVGLMLTVAGVVIALQRINESLENGNLTSERARALGERFGIIEPPDDEPVDRPLPVQPSQPVAQPPAQPSASSAASSALSSSSSTLSRTSSSSLSSTSSLSSKSSSSSSSSSQAQIKPVQFRASDCDCLGKPSAGAPSISTNRLSCFYAWPVQLGASKGTNQVQFEIAPTLPLSGTAQLNQEAAGMTASGAKLWRGQNYLYNVDARGGDFYYGEGRNVFQEGYYLSTHVRGYYGTSQQVQDLLTKSNECMAAAVAR